MIPGASVSGRDAVTLAESVTFTVNVAGVALVGVPLMVPLASARPAGSEPVVTLQVYGLSPVPVVVSRVRL